MIDQKSKGVLALRALLAGRIRLEFDVSKDKPEYHTQFEEKYAELTGSKTSKKEYNRVDKWGRQYRIYISLDAPQRSALQGLGLSATRNDQYQAQAYNYRITDEQLFWDLVELGFSLGDN